MKDWIECQSCWAEFKVVSDSDETVTFCPYCGGDVEDTEEDVEEEDDYE